MISSIASSVFTLIALVFISDMLDKRVDKIAEGGDVAKARKIGVIGHSIILILLVGLLFSYINALLILL